MARCAHIAGRERLLLLPETICRNIDVLPTSVDSLFTASSGCTYKSLQLQSALLLLRLTGVKTTSARPLFGTNHKMLERLGTRVQTLHKLYADKKEKEIVFGGSSKWQDVEADEATFARTAQAGRQRQKCALWEQWSGLVQRGKPRTLFLNRFNLPPGPGAIRKVDWRPVGIKHLQDRTVILHSDSARSYKLKLSGVLHESLVHRKKKVKINGECHWVNPKYVRFATHKLSSGMKLQVTSGTRQIHRAWRLLKGRLELNQSSKPGTPALALRSEVRSTSTGTAGRISGCAPGRLSNKPLYHTCRASPDILLDCRYAKRTCVLAVSAVYAQRFCALSLYS